MGEGKWEWRLGLIGGHSLLRARSDGWPLVLGPVAVCVTMNLDDSALEKRAREDFEFAEYIMIKTLTA